MGTMQRLRAGWLVVALGLCMVPAGRGHAQVNTERPGSLLIFPKVVNDGTRTTVIQISNTGNSLEEARCFYLDGKRCRDTDFHLTLTKQQPTFWDVAEGRTVRNTPNPIPGIMPGPVPPVPSGFTGALICASVDRGGAPAGTNSLIGKATLYGPGDNSSKYNAIAFTHGSGGNQADNDLGLDDAEYNACPGAVRVNFPNPSAPDPVIVASGNWGQCSVSGTPCNGDAVCPVPETCLDGICSDGTTRCDTAGLGPSCPVGVCSALTGSVTNVTVLPCNLNLDTLQPTALALSLNGSDGEQNPLSGSKNLSCWESFTLEARTGCSTGPGHACLTPPATEFATVNIKSTSGGPFVAVAETFHLDTAGNASSAAVNVFMAKGLCSDTSANAGQVCNNDSDCSGGTCVAPAPPPAGAGSAINLPAY